MRKQEMAKSARPKGSHRLSVQQPASGALPSDLHAIIRRGVDLGDGYLLIQLKESGKAKAEVKDAGLPPRQLRGVPKVRAADMRDLIARMQSITPPRGASTKAAKAATPAGTASRDNQEFLDQFGKKELVRRMELAAQGELIGSQDLAGRMGVTRQAITKAERDLRLFSLEGAAGRKLYPAFFADERVDRRQLQAVSKELDSLAGASKWQFFTNPRLSLGKRTPIEALRKGKYHDVLAAARAFREA